MIIKLSKSETETILKDHFTAKGLYPVQIEFTWDFFQNSSLNSDLDQTLLNTYNDTRSKIAMIKQHREKNGSGLKEAKDYCDSLLFRNGVQTY